MYFIFSSQTNETQEIIIKTNNLNFAIAEM